MSTTDAARKIAEQWAKQGKQFDPKQFNDDVNRKAALTVYNATKKS